MVITCGFIEEGGLQEESFSHLLFRSYITLFFSLLLKDKFIKN